MRPVKQTPITSARDVRQELRHLYARRSAIDTLIRSLEFYNEAKMRAYPEDRKRKQALAS